MTSIREVARLAGVDHSSIVKILNGTYDADPRHILTKIITAMGGVNIPPDKLDDVLAMLDECKFPAKFGSAQRTATWLYDRITEAKNENPEKEDG